MLVTYLGDPDSIFESLDGYQNAEKAHLNESSSQRFCAEKWLIPSSVTGKTGNRDCRSCSYGPDAGVAWNVSPETISVGQQYGWITISNYGIISEDTRMKLAKR